MLKFTPNEKKLLFAFGSGDPQKTAENLYKAGAAVNPGATRESMYKLARRIKTLSGEAAPEEYVREYNEILQEIEPHVTASVLRMDDGLNGLVLCHPVLEMAKSQIISICADDDLMNTTMRLLSFQSCLTDVSLTCTVSDLLDEINDIRQKEQYVFGQYVLFHRDMAGMINDGLFCCIGAAGKDGYTYAV